MPYRSLLEKLEVSDRVVVAVNDNGTTWKIARVLKGNDAIGSSIDVDQATATNWPQVLRWNIDSWQIAAPADPELVRFLVGAMSVSTSATRPPTIRQHAQQLRYFLPHLEHADANIADSTHARFSSAPYAALKEIAGDIDLSGEAAVGFIEDAYIRNHDRELGEVIAAVDALRTHGQAETKVSRERIKASFHLLLRERTPLAELVIDDFARWKDWSIAARLIEIYASGRQPWNNALIINYLKRCPQPSAREFLTRVSADSHPSRAGK